MTSGTHGITPTKAVASLRVGSGRKTGLPLFFGLLITVTVLHLVLAALMPASEQELRLWGCSLQFAPSCMDQPPLSAWMIRISTWIFGQNLFGIRLPAILMSSFTLVALVGLSSGGVLMALVLWTPAFLLGAVLMTPQIPLLFCWALYLAWTVRIQQSLESWNCDPVSRVYHKSPIASLSWVTGGVFLGLGLLSNYSMVLAAVCSLLTFFTRTRPRAWWKGYVLHLGIALLVALPVISYNWSRDFAPFFGYWDSLRSGSFSWSGFVSYWTDQALWVGLLPLLFLPRVLVQWPFLWNDSRMQPCIVFFLAPISYFFYKSLTASLEPAWVFVAYLACIPLAERVCQISSFKTYNRVLVFLSFIPAWLTTSALMVHSVRPIAWISPENDAFRLSRARMAVATQATQMLREISGQPLLVLAGTKWAPWFRFQGTLDATLDPELCQKNEIFVWKDAGKDTPSTFDCFAKKSVVANYPVLVSGKEMESFQLVHMKREYDRNSSNARP